MTLGEKLQTLRRSRGLPQEQLAEILEVSRQAVSKWENGRLRAGSRQAPRDLYLLRRDDRLSHLG